MIPELEGAADALEAEIEKLEDEEENLIAAIRQTIDDLEDLRFGKLSDGQLKNNVTEGLTSLQDACASKT